MSLWILIDFPEVWDMGHVQAHTGAKRFATVYRLNYMFPGNGVQQGLRYISSCLVDVSKMSAQSAETYIIHTLLKRPLAEWVQVKKKWSRLICVRCSSVYATIEYIRRHVCHKSFIVT